MTEMPKGECSFSSKICLSQLPDAFWRSNVTRLPPGAPLPEIPFTLEAMSCLGVVVASSPGPLDSTTNTSPLESV